MILERHDENDQRESTLVDTPDQRIDQLGVRSIDP
jgi:hypothetical protein